MCPKGKISASGPHLPTWALQHVGSFLGYTGHQSAPWKGAITQWETDPPGNFRSSR
jgi:hypothetical protein